MTQNQNVTLTWNPTFSIPFTPNWLKISQPTMANLTEKVGYNVSKWAIWGILQVFSLNEAQIHSEWPISCNSQPFPFSATKASHSTGISEIFNSGGGGGYIAQNQNVMLT